MIISRNFLKSYNRHQEQHSEALIAKEKILEIQKASKYHSHGEFITGITHQWNRNDHWFDSWWEASRNHSMTFTSEVVLAMGKNKLNKRRKGLLNIVGGG